MELQREGTIGLDCRRGFYDRILEGTVQQDALSEFRRQMTDDR
jgi:hypothetical protein